MLNIANITKMSMFLRYYGTGTIFGDISVSFIPLVSESVPDKWYKSRHIKPFFPILFLWILFGFILCQAYKGNLLANLVKVEYEKPLETFQVTAFIFMHTSCFNNFSH